jgi:kinesin family member 2/24
LVDLAGTEWDTGHYDKERRQESAEINKSLMALKECIRSLDDTNKKFIPFRGSKMTLMLRDSFIQDNSKVIMIICVSPALKKMEHTLVTLRYSQSIRDN